MTKEGTAASPAGAWAALLLAFSGLFAALRIWGMAEVCLDGDEVFSLTLARLGWQDLFKAAAWDAVHPPLFYLLLKPWIALGGDSLVWLRTLPVLLGVCAVFPLVLLARECGLGLRQTRVALALAALNPFLIYYSQHLRMYTLLLLLGLLSLWLFARIVLGGKGAGSAAALAVVNAALLCTQYFGGVLLALECLYVAVRRRERWAAVWLPSTIAVVAVLPWLAAALDAIRRKGGLAANLSWVTRPDLRDLLWFYVDMTGSAGIPVAVLTVVPLIALAVATATWLRSEPAGRGVHLLLFFGIAPALVAFAASYLGAQSVWGHRHLIYSAGPFTLLAGAALVRTPSSWLRRAAAAVFVLWGTAVVGLRVRGEDQKVPWDRLALRLVEAEQTSAGPVRVASLDPHMHYPLSFYLHELARGTSAGFSFDPPADAARRTAASRIHVSKADQVEIAPGRFWVAQSFSAKAQPSLFVPPAGCRRGGEPLRAGSRYQQVSLLPVRCEAPATMNP